MGFISRKVLIVGIVILLIALSIPLTIYLLGRSQDTRSRAGGGSVAVKLNPLTKSLTTGQQLEVSVHLAATGSDNVTAADITFTYDPALLEQASFAPTSTFSVITNTVSGGSIHYVGVNPTTNSISGTDIDLGTLKFKAKSAGTAKIGFSNIHVNVSAFDTPLPVDTDMTSEGTYTITGTTSNDGDESDVKTVCETCRKSNIDYACAAAGSSKYVCSAVNTSAEGDTCVPCDQDSTALDCSVATGKPNGCKCDTTALNPNQCRSNVCDTETQTCQATASSPNDRFLDLSFQIPGVGSGSAGLNNAPKNPTLPVTVNVYSVTTNGLVKTANGTVTYGNGKYAGKINLGALPDGPYYVKVKTENSLLRRPPANYSFNPSAKTAIDNAGVLVPGDFDGTNVIDLLDYQTFVSCLQGKSSCTSAQKTKSDFNDDGAIDGRDLNIMISAFTKRQGD